MQRAHFEHTEDTPPQPSSTKFQHSSSHTSATVALTRPFEEPYFSIRYINSGLFHATSRINRLASWPKTCSPLCVAMSVGLIWGTVALLMPLASRTLLLAMLIAFLPVGATAQTAMDYNAPREVFFIAIQAMQCGTSLPGRAFSILSATGIVLPEV